MFNERMALKMRLEQMNDAEERLLKELQKERGYIFNRLRELDEREKATDTSEQVHYLESTNSFIEGPTEDALADQSKTRKGRPSRRSKTTKMRESAIAIMKEHNSPIRGSELQKKIEDRTGFRIANMTTFMKTIEKADENIIKVGRGLYYYQQENQTIFLGQDLTDVVELNTKEL
ncbi:competence protein ComK [Lederbergia citrea]|uniref:Competence protein ComK n=1 Tax=Lederbergia citrea TaxID=2833581 RepID=A0A942Z312_9BACI|nr:competence protein ComK [Lederbergia citrea]MBS4176723.1 competence protein ComK [Lederbergia citrea]MBS4203284.1 competence protein ComK [Lederbergia citrea]MBS4222044.1 competence protein ComK [Lederbergia citrea]